MASIVDERGYNQSFLPTQAQQQRIRRRADAIIQALDLPAPAELREQKQILEIGCAAGELAAYLAAQTRAQVTGIDLSPQFIAEAIHRYPAPNLRFLVADLAKTPPAPARTGYHAIIGNGILHHLRPQLRQVLPALGRLLAPGGRLVFWEPNLRNPYIYAIFSFAPLRRLAKLEPDEMAFTAAFIRTELRAAGFRSTQVVPRDFLLPNTPTALIRPVCWLGDRAERMPGVRQMAQSVFMVAGDFDAGSAERPIA